MGIILQDTKPARHRIALGTVYQRSPTHPAGDEAAINNLSTRDLTRELGPFPALHPLNRPREGSAFLGRIVHKRLISSSISSYGRSSGFVTVSERAGPIQQRVTPTGRRPRRTNRMDAEETTIQTGGIVGEEPTGAELSSSRIQFPYSIVNRICLPLGIAAAGGGVQLSEIAARRAIERRIVRWE